jgi:hypothetical protein
MRAEAAIAQPALRPTHHWLLDLRDCSLLHVFDLLDQLLVRLRNHLQQLDAAECRAEYKR